MPEPIKLMWKYGPILLLASVCAPLARSAEPATRPAPAVAAAPAAPDSRPVPLTAGDYRRLLVIDGRQRSYRVHVPPKYDPAKPAAVVLAFHGAMMNAGMMPAFTGLNAKADTANFVVAYPDGTGVGDAFLFFNASADPKPGGPVDDVLFTSRLLDDLATVVTVDPKRVFATGISNGGMMCHRLAAELSDRIAAIAPVGGTLALPEIHPKRPVPVIHFHGSADTIVPFAGPKGHLPRTMQFRSVDETIQAWVDADGCPAEPKATHYADDAKDGTTVTCKTYGPGKEGAEVVLVEVEGGGHTWPGMPSPVKFIGKSTMNISADDLLWEFFERHPMK